MLGCHLAAAFSATATGLHAFLHVTNSLAIIGTLLANFSALTACMLVVGRSDQHKMGARPANFGACHHKLEVSWLCMLTAHCKAMVHRHAEACGVAR